MTFLKKWLPAILMCLFIFTASSMPGATVSSNGSVDWSAHKIAHYLIYFTLTFTFFRATKSIPLSILLAVVYGITDELHQTFVPSRSGNVNDIAVDGFGALTAGVILWKYYLHLPQKLKTWLQE